jgi:hypothetical protein
MKPPDAIAHLYCVLVNEFHRLSADPAVGDPFTTPQFRTFSTERFEHLDPDCRNVKLVPAAQVGWLMGHSGQWYEAKWNFPSRSCFMNMKSPR